MSELLTEIDIEAQKFLGGNGTDIQRIMHRAAVIEVDEGEIEIEQRKFVAPAELELVRAKGALALATTEWFNDVKWLDHPHKERIGWQDLMLDATYPLEYFDSKPVNGSFMGSDENPRWLDQYGSMSGFGDNDGINFYVPEFVAPDKREITQLRYPDDPTALDTYNQRYRLYMDDLDAADTTVSYTLAWTRSFSREKSKAPLSMGGHALSSVGVNKLLKLGKPGMRDAHDWTRILLQYSPEHESYVGRDVTIIGGDAVTERFWDDEDGPQPANEELLSLVLEHIRSLNVVESN